MSFKTLLYESHIKLGARMVDFHGWEMPVQYSGIVDEHLCVRSNAGLFDLTHMGEIEVTGSQAGEFLNYVTCNNINKLSYDGKIIYSSFLNEQGGIIDDLLIYRRNENNFYLVVNASNVKQDFEWIKKYAVSFDVSLKDLTMRTGLVAVQGPKSVDIIKKLTGNDFSDLTYYHCMDYKIDKLDALISRTGYTGEDGFEIYVPWDNLSEIWGGLLDAGSSYGLKPVGLGARDTLRLEMRYSLHGNEINETTLPLSAGLSWIVDLKKDDFIGKDALLNAKAQGNRERLIGFTMAERGIPRQGYTILYGDEKVGTVTSGTMSPSLKNGIGMGYILNSGIDENDLYVLIHNKKKKMAVHKGPFVKPKIYKK